MQTTEASRITARSWVGPLLALFAVAVVVPIFVAQHYNALNIPRSDDWSYLHTFFLWHRDGTWDFNDWVSMTLVGQLFVSLPIVAIFGESITALSVTWAVIGFGALVAVVAMARVLGRPPHEGFLVALCLALCPLWGALAPTFMTDVPAFAFEMFALALGTYALRRRRPGWFVAAVAVGFVGVAIRQYALLPLAALLLVAGWQARARSDRAWFRLAAWSFGVLVVATLALMAWWSQVPNGKALGPQLPNVESVRLTIANTANFLRLAGLVLLPAVVYARPRRIVERALRTDRLLTLRLLGGTVALLLAGWALAPERPFVGNYVHARGVLADDIIAGTRPYIMPKSLFDLLVIVATIAAVVLVAAAVPFLHEFLGRNKTRSWRTIATGDPVVGTMGLTVAGFAIVYPLATLLRMGFSELTAVFDRYALPFLPLTGLLFLSSVAVRRAADPEREPDSRARTRTLTGIALGALALLGLVYTAESASFDATRWALAEQVVDLGYSPLQIHAGYEWEGWYRGQGPLTAETIETRKALRAAYFRGMCVTIAIAPPHIPDKTLAVAESDAWTRKPAKFIAVRNERSCDIPPGLGKKGEPSPR
jgi:hypothetical protein